MRVEAVGGLGEQLRRGVEIPVGAGRVDVARSDVLVTGDRIAAVGRDLVAPAGATVVDGRDRLLMPGLVNAHLHSWEAIFRGRYDNLPLELWMLLSYPILGLTPLSERLIELRTQLVAIESLKGGVTCVLDDVIESPGQSMGQLEAVFAGYSTLGIRANVSGNIVDRFFTDTIPYANEVLPAELLEQVHATPPRSAAGYLDFSREALHRFHGKDGLLRYVVAPSGPQRCTDELLVAADALSAEFDTTLHVHVLETKVQAVTGQEMFGSTLIAHLAKLGVLSDRLTVAHGIWLTDSDIARAGRGRVLGGAQRDLQPEARRRDRPGPRAARRRCERGAGDRRAVQQRQRPDVRRDEGGRAAAEDRHTGSRELADRIRGAVGRDQGRRAQRPAGRRDRRSRTRRKADLVLLDLNTVNFTPLNDVRNHLVYCENGTSIVQVMVDGRVVVADGRCLLVDEDAVLEEVRALAPEMLARHAEAERATNAFAPYFTEIHRRCCAQQLPINRYAGDESAWIRRGDG